MITFNLSSLEPNLATILGWILTYLIHSTAFYLLVKLALLIPKFNFSHIKEYLWRGALFGGIITASFQTFSGFSLISLPVGEIPEAAPTTVIVNENTSDRMIYKITSNEAAVAIEGSKEVITTPAAPVYQKPIIVKKSSISVNGKFWLLLASLLAISIISILYKVLDHCHFILKIKPLDKVKDPSLHLLVHDLCVLIPYRKRIKLKSSKSLKSPVALGDHKIFVPEYFIKNLPAEQLKSLLAHELAHLVRKDSWWNGAYGFIEAVLFFQPVNRIIRKKLQENAELLCDERAVKITGNKIALASCLLEVAGWYTNPISSSIVPGMALHKKSLHHRINNILNYQFMKTRSNSALTYLLMLAIGLLVILATPGFTLAPQQEVPEPVQPPKPKVNAPSHELKSIIPVEPKAKIPENIEVEAVEEIEVDPVITEDLEIDLDMNLDLDLDWDINPSLEDSFGSFNDLNVDHNFYFNFNDENFFQLQDSLLKNFEINFEDHFKENFNYVFSIQDGDTNKIRSRSIIINNNEKKVIIENGEVKELWIDGKKIPDDEIKNHNIVIEDFNSRFRYHDDAQGRLREAEIRSRDAEIRAKDAELRAKEAQVRAERRREEIEIRKAETDIRRRETESRRIDAEERRKEAEKRRMEADERRAAAEKFNKILEENLIKDNLIENVQNFSFHLNNEELKINDVKQPEKVHKKYKKLYESETGNSLKENSNFIIRKN